MEIDLSIFASGDDIVNNYIVARAAETSAPTAFILQEVYPPVQVFPMNILLSNARPVPHIVEIWSSSDGVALDTLLHDFLYDPSYKNVILRAPVELQVNRGGPYDPNSGDNTFPAIDGTVPGFDDISTWIGDSQWWPEMRSKGGKLLAAEYTIPAGNQRFILVGTDQFYAADAIFICFPPKITTITPTFVTSDAYSGYKRITASASVAPDWYGKYVDLVMAGASNNVITLQALAEVPDNKLLSLFSMNGAQKQITVRTTGGETIQWFGLDLTEIYIGLNEDVHLYKYTDPDTSETFYKIAKALQGMADVGKAVDIDTGLLESPLHPNVSAADGGALVIAEHPRVAWFVNRLPAGQLLLKSQRNANPLELGSFWAIDDGPTPVNVWKPDRRGLTARGIPGTRGNDSGRDANAKAGSYDGSHLMQHDHANGDYNGLLRKSDGNPHDTAATFSGVRPQTFPYVQTFGVMTPGGDRDENTVKNFGVVKAIYI